MALMNLIIMGKIVQYQHVYVTGLMHCETFKMHTLLKKNTLETHQISMGKKII